LRHRCVALESDIQWSRVPASADDDDHSRRNVWLRLAKNIGQASLPIIRCGTALPDQFERFPEQRSFARPRCKSGWHNAPHGVSRKAMTLRSAWWRSISGPSSVRR
jgi:hypothetical protein